MRNFLLCVAIILPCGLANADDAEPESNWSNAMKYFAIAEVGAVGMSKLAANNPEGYGNAIIALSPFFAAFGESKSKASYTIGLLAVVAYGAYNRNLKDEEESDVFRKNMILFNSIIIPATILIGLRNNVNEEKPTQYMLNINQSGGLEIAFSHAF